MGGCKFPPSLLPSTGNPPSHPFPSDVIPPVETLTVLSVTGGLCLIAGMVLLVITGGRKGWYPVLGGVILVILNYMVAQYSDWLFYPLVVCSALVSGAWTYKTTKQILMEKKCK